MKQIMAMGAAFKIPGSLLIGVLLIGVISWPVSAYADLEVILGLETELSYALSPSNYANSPSNYSNSPSNYSNSSSNYSNSEWYLKET